MNDEPVFSLNKENNNFYLHPEAANKTGKDHATPYMFKDENEDIVFSPIACPHSIYHYCNINTMVNIFQNRCMWMTNCQCSNDSNEMFWSINKLEEIIYELLDKIKEYEHLSTFDEYLKCMCAPVKVA